MRVCTVQEMRECDRRAVEDYGLSDAILMENAGQAVYEVVKREFDTSGSRFVVVCGAGNNGGDGLVVARKLHSLGAKVKVYLLADGDSMRGAARSNFDAVICADVPLQRIHSAEELCFEPSCDVVIDAILGTGLSRSPEGLYAEAIERVNASSLSVLAVDIPSGVNGDTGATPGVAVRATCTVSFGLPKRGNLLPPGRELCGRFYVSHISFPPSLYGGVGSVETSRSIPLPVRPLESHKGSYGDVLFVAGARSYLGAPVLAAKSFLRAGGGYARLATPESLVLTLGSHASEAVMIALQETNEGTVALSNLELLCDLGEHADMLVIGPGLSVNQETQELVRRIVSKVPVPVLIDGDGLTAVAQDPACVRERTAPTILTPHPGEMARLLHTTVACVEQDRVLAVQEATGRLGVIVLLKGSSTLIGGVDGPVSLNLTGNPGMATAGCGDVLSGTIAAMSGMGLSPRDAVEVGALIHGVAGDLAAADKGQDGLIATDVMEYLPGAVRRYRETFCRIGSNHTALVNVI